MDLRLWALVFWRGKAKDSGLESSPAPLLHLILFAERESPTVPAEDLSWGENSVTKLMRARSRATRQIGFD